MKLEPLPMRIIFFGMVGSFSLPSLAALFDAGYDVRAVVIPQQAGATQGDATSYRRFALPASGAPRARPTLPMLSTSGLAPDGAPRTIIEFAARRLIPVYEVTRLNDPGFLTLLASFAPDVICVACFSRRLPPGVVRLPRLGCLNVHPSLLPDNRGPDPLFWTFRRGEAFTGVTVHLLDEGFDSGPIVIQKAMDIPAGTTEAALEARLATLGGKLLARAVEGLATGALHPTPQDTTRATGYGWPQDDDYVIDLRQGDWSAERAYRFACGIGGRGQAMMIIATDGARFRLIAPLEYLEYSDDWRSHLAHNTAWRQEGGDLWLRCARGMLHVRADPLS